MKHTLLLLISCLFVPCLVQAQATNSIPLGKNIGVDTHVPVKVNISAMDRAIQNQLNQASQKAQAQEVAKRKHVQNKEALHLTHEDMLDDKEYVSTPQGDIRKGSWQACEYFYNWDKHQQSVQTSVELYQAHREMVLLTFGITEESCHVLAQQHKQEQSPALHMQVPQADVAQLRVPSAVQTGPIVHRPVETQVAQKSAKTQEFWSDVRNEGYHDIQWKPRKIKRYLKKYMEEHCSEIQEALALQARGEYLRSRYRIVLTGYNSLCDAYENTLGVQAPACLEVTTCKPVQVKPKEEQVFLTVYDQAVYDDAAARN